MKLNRKLFDNEYEATLESKELKALFPAISRNNEPHLHSSKKTAWYR